MTSLTSILALYGLLVMLTILLQVLLTAGQVPLPELAGNREDMPHVDGAAGRLDRAQKNSVIAMALFAPPVLILSAGEVSASALLAAQVFLLARVVYVVVYALGIPWVRTLAWLAGFIMTGWLYLMVL